ncbi:hypothetical protein [Cytobacillus sp. SAFR-174]|uniref:hypothetical protein n=1 Tax=Cytobacillus sp. SAFR-174 TaxID=3436868 RepID=UPI003F80B8A9
MSEKERPFFLNKAMYNMQIAPIFKRENFRPKIIFQYALFLPFQLPFPPKGFITHIISQYERLTFSFEDKVIDNQMLIGSYREGKPINLHSAKTRVEMNYFTSNKVKNNSIDDNYISDVFDNLLSHLNKIIVSYVIKTKDTSVYKVTREMLPPNILCRYIKNLDFDMPEDNILMLHNQVPYIKDTISIDEFLEIQQYAMFIKNGINPFVISEEFMLGAKRRYMEGNYKEAVINAQTSLETFLTTLYKHMCLEEGKTEQVIEQQLSFPQYKGVTQFVKDKFKKRLGGNWDIRDRSGWIGKWHLKSNKLRNKIVHSGYEPNYQETSESIHAATELRLYIVDLLKKKSQKYPKCNEFIYKK